jgi:hypothetical protein
MSVTQTLGSWTDRVEAADWRQIRADLDNSGCGPTGPLLTPDETAEIIALYDDDSRFRSTINMGRHRFGEGEYRYFAPPFPDAVTGLKQALYPKLLPIARDWWTKLGRDTPWPDGLEAWLDMCHAAGFTTQADDHRTAAQWLCPPAARGQGRR